MPSGKHDAPGYLLKMAQAALHKAKEERLNPLGLTLSQYAVLVQLDIKPEQTNAELARNAFITAQSMQGVLSRLEAAGLIGREQDADHGRRQPAKLTGKGKQLLEKAQVEVQAVEAKLIDAVKPFGRDELCRLFIQIHEAFSGNE